MQSISKEEMGFCEKMNQTYFFSGYYQGKTNIIKTKR
jgi:hypothetical protein